MEKNELRETTIPCNNLGIKLLKSQVVLWKFETVCTVPDAEAEDTNVNRTRVPTGCSRSSRGSQSAEESTSVGVLSVVSATSTDSTE